MLGFAARSPAIRFALRRGMATGKDLRFGTEVRAGGLGAGRGSARCGVARLMFHTR